MYFSLSYDWFCVTVMNWGEGSCDYNLRITWLFGLFLKHDSLENEIGDRIKFGQVVSLICFLFSIITWLSDYLLLNTNWEKEIRFNCFLAK